MSNGNRQTVLIWIIVILVATNLATVGSIWYSRSSRPAKSFTNERSDTADRPIEQRAHFFGQQLNLSEDQLAQFREFNRSFNRRAHGIENELVQLRSEMITELGKESSDTIRLGQLATEMGNHHRELKQLTTELYLQMKSICSAEQQVKLNQLFQSMLNKENQLNLPRGQGNRGRRHNQ